MTEPRRRLTLPLQGGASPDNISPAGSSDPGELPAFARHQRLRPPSRSGPPSNGSTANGAPGSNTNGASGSNGHPVTAVNSVPTYIADYQSSLGAQLEPDWDLVQMLRREIASDLDAESLSTLPRADKEELGRRQITERLSRHVEATIATGAAQADDWPQARFDATAKAVFDAAFRTGRIQPLLDRDDVENIRIYGDRVWLHLAAGRRISSPPVAESDDELIDLIAQIVTRLTSSPRPFTQANPTVHAKLDDGSRLVASAWITPRPTVLIRRHRFIKVTLADLVEQGSLDPVAASFLGAAVRANKSILICGPQSAGKTTMLRALCAAMDPWEVVGTFESEFELLLHENPAEDAPIIHAWEAREGSGEATATGENAGEVPLADILKDSYRFGLSRLVVGEVRGPEFVPMLQAMQSGAGSMSTTHAASADDVVDRLVTAAVQWSGFSDVAAPRMIASSVDLIVHLHYRPIEGKGQRYVHEVRSVSPSTDSSSGVDHTTIFKPNPSGGPAVPGTLPDHLRDLVDYGFDLAGYTLMQDGPS